MTKKEYQKPTLNVVKLKTHAHILTVSDVKTTGLDDDLNYNGGSGNMDDAMSRRRKGVLDEEEEEDW